MKNCSFCKRKIPNKSVFCPFCGKKWVNVCPNCGFDDLPEKALFCPNCGGAISKNRATQQNDQKKISPANHRKEATANTNKTVRKLAEPPQTKSGNTKKEDKEPITHHSSSDEFLDHWLVPIIYFLGILLFALYMLYTYYIYD